MPTPRGEPSVPYDKYPIMRLVLHIMRAHYPELSGKDRLQIFNIIFKQHLLEAGFPKGELNSHDKLDSQYRESRKEKNKEKWAGIIKDPLDLDDGEYDTYQVFVSLIKMYGKQLGTEMKSVGNGSSAEEEEEEDSEMEEEGEEESEGMLGGGEEKFGLERVSYVDGDGVAHEADAVKIPNTWAGKGGLDLVLKQIDADEAFLGDDEKTLPTKVTLRKKSNGKV